MLAKANRLTKKKDFEKTFKQGGSSYGKLLGIKAVKNDLESNRFGLIISNKVSKKAVERNKIRRQIREILKEQLAQLKPGFDLIIVTLPEILNKDSQEIKQNILYNFKRLRLYK